MAIDPNILLRGITPDLAQSVGQGLSIGREIVQGPLRNQLLQQELGEKSSIALNSIVGDLTVEEITPEIFANSVQAAQDLGVKLSREETQFTPQNVNKLVTLSQAGKRFAQQRRGGGQTGFQTNAPVITEQGGQKFFTSLQTDRATGQQKVSNIPISGTITDRLGLSAGDRVNQKQQEEIAKATGRTLGEAAVSGVAEETAAGLIEAEEQAKVQVAANTAQKVADTAATIELEKGLAKGRANRIAEDLEKGAIAADSLGTVNRALDLLDIVETGGFENLGLRAQQSFGIEGADEAELNSLLQTAVLQQLRPTFGSAFTENEGARLERISQSFGRNTKTNIRLLKQMKQINERAANRGIDAAVAAKDFDRAKQIQESIDFRFSFDDQQPNEQQAQQALQKVQSAILQPGVTENSVIRNSKGWPRLIDKDGNRAFVGPNGEIEEIGSGL